MEMYKNLIWKYFEKCGPKAKCTVCSKMLSLGSNEPKYQTITGLKKHLEKIHKSEWVKYCEKIQEKNKQKSSVEKPAQQQQTLDELFLRNSKWPDDHPISKRIDKSIMDLILVDMLPYNVVEGPAFQRMKFADPSTPNQYNIKTEKFFRTALMPETFDKVKKKVIIKMEGAKWISFTTDIWSSHNNSFSLLSFTAHYIEEESRKKIILGASVLENDHKGAYISEKLSEIIKNYKLEEKVHIAVCDNARNMGAAMKLGNITSLGCVAHTVQLVIHDAIFKEKHIQEIIKKCRGIIGHFKRSEQAARHLKNIQEKCSIKKHSLIQDIDTRWNSTYLMMERLIEQKSAINIYSIEKGGIAVLTHEEWDLLNDMVASLECFYEATIDLSGDSSSASLITPLVDMLRSKMDEDGYVDKFRSSLKDALNKRFKYIETSPFLITATLLDPRFKNKYLSEAQFQIADKEISEFFDHTPLSNNLETTAVPEEIIKRGRKLKGSLWKRHDSMSSSIDMCQNNLSFKKELLLYLREPLNLRKSNIYEYWYSSPYINLKQAALKYLSAPPTSVASEQLFSAAGRLYTDRRVNLKGVNVEKLLFCHYNIKLFDFDY